MPEVQFFIFVSSVFHDDVGFVGLHCQLLNFACLGCIWFMGFFVHFCVFLILLVGGFFFSMTCVDTLDKEFPCSVSVFLVTDYDCFRLFITASMTILGIMQ